MDETKKNERKEIRRRNILDGALKAFCEKGVDGTTIDDICEKVGCSHGLFYHYYVSKEELISDLHKKWDTEIIEHSLDVLNSDIKTVDKLREILTYVFVNVKDDEIFAYRFYFFVTEIFRRNERVEFFSEAEKKMIIEHSSKKVSRISSLPKIVNDLFVKGVEEGVIKDDRPVKEYFKLLMDIIVGVTMHIILTPKERRNEIKIPDVDLILSVFINKEALTN